MDVIKWILGICLSLVLGAFIAQYLTVHPLQMSRFLALALVTLFLVVILIAYGTKGKLMVLTILVSIFAIVLGYGAMSKAILSREDSRDIPELVRTKGQAGDGHTAVIYFTHGEPETYDPIGWLNQFREFDEQELDFIPFLLRPYFIYKLREAYLRVGQSDHRDMHMRMLKSLEEAYRSQGDESTQFYISFLDDAPRPDAAVIQALNDGASHIIVSEVFLTISNHTAEGEELIKDIGVEDYGATLTFTGPLWDSNELRSMFVERANRHIGDTPKDRVGVLLVGHGQPDEWDVEWPTETEQETVFRQEVLALFEQDGYNENNLSLAWMEFKEPKPAEKIEEFWENGVEKVAYFAAAISAESIHSQYEIPELVHEANVPEDMVLINLGAWNDDPLVIKGIKVKIDQLMEKQ